MIKLRLTGAETRFLFFFFFKFYFKCWVVDDTSWSKRWVTEWELFWWEDLRVTLNLKAHFRTFHTS